MKKMFTDFNNKFRKTSDTINEFISTKRGRRADETVKYYEERLSEFNKFLIDSGISDIGAITRLVVDSFIDHKKKKNPALKNQSLNNILRAIRTFINYCINEGYIKYFKIEMFPTTNIPKASYTDEEQALLLKKPDLSKCSFTEYRNWVVICHFLASGNRSKTVRHIKIKHVELNKRRITLDTTKNNEVLYMPISDTYYPILRDYLKARNGNPEDYLFCSQYGKQLTGGGLRSIMRKHNLKHGVKTTSLHRYRNTFAEAWIMNDGNPKKLQYALGHKTQHMVDEYVSMYGKELKEEFNDLAPLSLKRAKVESKSKIRL